MTSRLTEHEYRKRMEALKVTRIEQAAAILAQDQPINVTITEITQLLVTDAIRQRQLRERLA